MHPQGASKAKPHQPRHAGGARVPRERHRPPRDPDAAHLGRHRHGEDLGARGEQARVHRLPPAHRASTTDRPRRRTSCRSTRRPRAAAAAGAAGHRPQQAAGARAGARGPRRPRSGDGGTRRARGEPAPPRRRSGEGSSTSTRSRRRPLPRRTSARHHAEGARLGLARLAPSEVRQHRPRPDEDDHGVGRRGRDADRGREARD